MSRRALAAPLALLPASTLAHDLTPAGPLERGVAIPVSEQVVLPRSEEAISAWQLPSDNPWAAYSKLTLLAWIGPGQGEIDLPRVRLIPGFSTAQCAASGLASAGVPKDSLWILDLRGADSVAFAASLSRFASEAIAPVLTFNNWPAPPDRELIPAEETLSALLSVSPVLPSSAMGGVPVFLLDAWRRAFADQPVPPEAYDNRYALGPADFPDVNTLRRNGITQVVYVVEDLDFSPNAEEDVSPILAEYQGAGIAVSMVDLKSLCEPPLVVTREPWDGPAWALWRETFRLHAHLPRPAAFRELCERSPGGFGGANAAPVHFAAASLSSSGGVHGGGG